MPWNELKFLPCKNSVVEPWSNRWHTLCQHVNYHGIFKGLSSEIHQIIFCSPRVFVCWVIRYLSIVIQFLFRSLLCFVLMLENGFIHVLIVNHSWSLAVVDVNAKNSQLERGECDSWELKVRVSGGGGGELHVGEGYKQPDSDNRWYFINRLFIFWKIKSLQQG